ncbi:NAD(+)/NADH kinase [Halanaerobium sp. Z-7514]|uniref:NAD(+)/NADH kinase n=1 Tax=Halanaerobium polyolivorans TaxID=2886943 RepID=A0AAW4WWL0_9FIRM|nr:NAD(+)/NADH kinase [Halanaerobium polyolivorans]
MTENINSVGIIANPASGRDIRRLVAHGSVFDNVEKVNIVRRILLALNNLDLDKVYIMPDSFGIGNSALNGLWGEEKKNFKIDVDIMNMTITGSAEDSFNAACLMEEKGVDVIIVLGGDGTNRVVVKALKNTAVLSLSTGTNNVFPIMAESTMLGLAAGLYTKFTPEEREKVTQPIKCIYIIKDGEIVDIALIDAVVVNESYIGSKALWHVELLEEILVTRSTSYDIGMVSIAGRLTDVGVLDNGGAFIRIGDSEHKVKAAIAPGVIKTIPIKDWKKIKQEEVIELPKKKRIIALDGEREVVVKKDEKLKMQLTYAPARFLDYKAALELADSKKMLEVK